MSSDVFREVAEEDIPKVLTVLKQDWPKHFNLYQILTTLEVYKKAGTKWKHTLYLCGDYETGVYLNKTFYDFPDKSRGYVYVYTTNSNLTELNNALQKTKIIPWDKGQFCFQMIPDRISKPIEEVASSKYIDYSIDLNTLYLFPDNKELHILPLPDDVYVEFLDESHAAEMDMNWPHRFPGSELKHKEDILNNFGKGLFRKADKKMLSSALSSFTGGIYVLFTHPEFRGKGYATFVIKDMVQEIRKRNRIPFATVSVGNKFSENTFTKIGFETFSIVAYIIVK